jgi:hypothetical protein
MNLVAWILSALLAFAFFAGGLMKALSGKEKLLRNPRMAWAEDFSDTGVRAIGAIEALGALGVILPWLTDIAPVLSPLAATGLGITMVVAMAVHVRRNEREALVTNAVLLLLAASVAVLRFVQL